MLILLFSPRKSKLSKPSMENMDLKQSLKVVKTIQRFFDLIIQIILILFSQDFLSSTLMVRIFSTKLKLLTRLGALRYRAGDIKMRQVNVVGDLLKGDHSIYLLDPFYIFKGKLRIVATRQKYYDATDLRQLESKYRNILLERYSEINIGYIGLTLKKSLELEACFQRIGVNIEAVKKRVASVDLSKLPPLVKSDILKGLLE